MTVFKVVKFGSRPRDGIGDAAGIENHATRLQSIQKEIGKRRIRS